MTKLIYRPCPKLAIKVAVFGGGKEFNDTMYDAINVKTSNDGKTRMTIDTGDFLVFSYNSRANNENLYEEIFLGLHHIYSVVKAFQSACDFFDKELYPDLFNKVEGEWTVNNIDYPKTNRKISNLGGNKTIMLSPGIVNENQRGIVLYINSKDKWCELNERDFKTLTWNLERIDVPSIAASMLNFAIHYDRLQERVVAAPKVQRIGGRSE
jgi:hypothetical protein